ncbi:MAG: hypothetical protein Q4C36_07970 [Coriobacteriia bacterium]|nr:hypothetical protein [Coriobacteriia bacterium]
MALFGRNKVERTAEYVQAERVLNQTEAFCKSVLEYVDGTSEAEQKMVAEVRDKLSNAERLMERLQEGSLDPRMCTTMGFSLTFNQLLEIVEKLDGSTPAEAEMINAAKAQIQTALQAGYAPAVELQQQGKLPL